MRAEKVEGIKLTQDANMSCFVVIGLSALTLIIGAAFYICVGRKNEQ